MYLEIDENVDPWLGSYYELAIEMESRSDASLVQNAVNILVDEGAESVRSVAEIVKHSEIVITMLPNPQTVLDVLIGSNGSGKTNILESISFSGNSFGKSLVILMLSFFILDSELLL